MLFYNGISFSVDSDEITLKKYSQKYSADYLIYKISKHGGSCTKIGKYALIASAVAAGGYLFAQKNNPFVRSFSDKIGLTDKMQGVIADSIGYGILAGGALYGMGRVYDDWRLSGSLKTADYSKHEKIFLLLEKTSFESQDALERNYQAEYGNEQNKQLREEKVGKDFSAVEDGELFENVELEKRKTQKSESFDEIFKSFYGLLRTQGEQIGQLCEGYRELPRENEFSGQKRSDEQLTEVMRSVNESLKVTQDMQRQFMVNQERFQGELERREEKEKELIDKQKIATEEREKERIASEAQRLALQNQMTESMSTLVSSVERSLEDMGSRLTETFRSFGQNMCTQFQRIGERSEQREGEFQETFTSSMNPVLEQMSLAVKAIGDFGSSFPKAIADGMKGLAIEQERIQEEKQRRLENTEEHKEKQKLAALVMLEQKKALEDADERRAHEQRMRECEIEAARKNAIEQDIKLKDLAGGRITEFKPTCYDKTSSILKFRYYGFDQIYHQNIQPVVFGEDDQIMNKKLQASGSCEQYLKEKHFESLNGQLGGRKNGILLHGGPGNGKTAFYQYLVSRLISERKASQVHVFFLSKSDVFSSYNDDITVENIKTLKKNVYDLLDKTINTDDKVIVVFNEADSIFTKRAENSGEKRGPVNEFLGMVEECYKLPRLMIMATTNNLNACDPAMIRDQRFDIKLPLGRPNLIKRYKIALTLATADWVNDMPQFEAGETEGKQKIITLSYPVLLAILTTNCSCADMSTKIAELNRNYFESKNSRGNSQALQKLIKISMQNLYPLLREEFEGKWYSSVIELLEPFSKTEWNNDSSEVKEYLKKESQLFPEIQSEDQLIKSLEFGGMDGFVRLAMDLRE